MVMQALLSGVSEGYGVAKLTRLKFSDLGGASLCCRLWHFPGQAGDNRSRTLRVSLTMPLSSRVCFLDQRRSEPFKIFNQFVSFLCSKLFHGSLLTQRENPKS